MMSPTIEKSVETRTHGRYLLVPGDPRRILVGFHGYAENADRHLAELQRIPGADAWTLVAVQALHRFYNTRTQEVVASWMTRQDRELAMADNLAYVGKVLAEVGRGERLVFAGFSQGTPMTYRAAAAFGPNGLLILGGDCPPDVSAQESVQLPPILLGRGERDEWYTAEKFEQDLRFLERASKEVTTLVFDGAHEWSDPFRAKAGEFLGRLRLAVDGPSSPSGGLG